MDTQKLLVHQGCERQRTKRLQTGFIHSLGILVLAFKLKGKVVCQMLALVVPAQEKERVGVPDFQRPEIQHALRMGKNEEGVSTSMEK